MEKLEQAVMLLDQIIEDRTVPRNIRENSQKAKENLLDESLELSVRIDKAIQLLDEVSEDPNIPVYTRTQVWNVVTLLESLLSK
ncbi:MAG: UPF0147 family protein [Candidatus Aenigmarchaeota archaeon]|nr:UPF0147 family protein [Candidatus Aenigmarchaeota archaeon]